MSITHEHSTTLLPVLMGVVLNAAQAQTESSSALRLPPIAPGSFKADWNSPPTTSARNGSATRSSASGVALGIWA
jgi:hypothetical protein